MVSDKALQDGMAWSAEDYSLGFQVDYTIVKGVLVRCRDKPIYGSCAIDPFQVIDFFEN